MMAAPQEAGLLALPGTLGSGWSSGTHAQAVEQQAWSDGLYSLQSQGEPSIKPLTAQQQHAAAAACMQQQQQAWQVCMQSPAGPALLQAQAPVPIGWQHSSDSSYGSLQYPIEAAAAMAAAAASELDPWSSGLELVAATAPAEDAAAAPLPLTDAGLDALLAPFEDWPFVLQPAGSAVQVAPAALLQPPAACVGMQQQQLAQPQACAAAVHSPGGSSGGQAGCCTCTCGAAAAGGTAAPAAAPAKAPRRRGGRPRVHHPRGDSAAPEGEAGDGGSAGALTASAAAGAPPPLGQPFKKSGRGPKPKYIFQTQEEAADARRERNRKAALESYYRKKEHTTRLQQQLTDLQEENAALQQLLAEMATTGLCPLLEASNEGIDLWLRQRQEVAQEAAAAEPMPL
ncbi:hypothetical protein ABPG75_010227 [Micractinium tetrahymenae]